MSEGAGDATMEDLDSALGQLAKTKVDRDLAGLETDVWEAVAQLESGRKRAALLRPVSAAGVIGALLLGVATGSGIERSGETAELDVFSSRLPLAPSTLLGGAG